jgi:hypothetical protein
MNPLVSESLKALVVGAVLIIISASTFAAEPAPAACPDLTGTYACKDEKGLLSKIAISQEIVNGQTIYTTVQDGNSTQSPTDNYPYPINDVQNNVSGLARFSCAAASFISDMKGQKTNAKKTVIASWEVKQILSLTANGDLQMQVQGYVTAQGKTTPSPDQKPNICPRISKK